MINIYVGSYAGYNQGILDGRWHKLPSMTLWEDIEDSCVDGAEEFGIFDYEADFTINELDSIDDLNDIAETLFKMDEYEKTIINVLIDEGCSLEDAIDHVNDCILHPVNDMSDVAYNYYTDCGLIDENNPLFNYIDWDAIGRDMSFDGNFVECDDGIVEILF